MSNLPAGVNATDQHFNGSNSFHHKNGRCFTDSVMYIDEDGFEQFEIVTYELYQGGVAINEYNDYLTAEDLECITESIKEMNEDYFKAYRAL